MRSFPLPADLFRQALRGALQEHNATLKRVSQTLKSGHQAAYCPHCGGGIVADDALLRDSNVQVKYPDAGEPYLQLLVDLECSTCESEFVIDVVLNILIEGIAHVGVADVDPPGAGDSRSYSSREIHAHFDGTGNWSR